MISWGTLWEIGCDLQVSCFRWADSQLHCSFEYSLGCQIIEAWCWTTAMVRFPHGTSILRFMWCFETKSPYRLDCLPLLMFIQLGRSIFFRFLIYPRETRPVACSWTLQCGWCTLCIKSISLCTAEIKDIIIVFFSFYSAFLVIDHLSIFSNRYDLALIAGVLIIYIICALV